MHGALAHGLVDLLNRGAELLVGVVSASSGGFVDCTGAGAQLGTDRTVTSVALFRLAVALDLALNVCHYGLDLEMSTDPSIGPADKRSRR